MNKFKGCWVWSLTDKIRSILDWIDLLPMIHYGNK